MQDQDGNMRPLREFFPDLQNPAGGIAEVEERMAATMRRIASAGGREVPIFSVGEEVEVNGGRFKVLGWGGKLLVLEGLPRKIC